MDFEPIITGLLIIWIIGYLLRDKTPKQEEQAVMTDIINNDEYKVKGQWEKNSD